MQPAACTGLGGVAMNSKIRLAMTSRVSASLRKIRSRPFGFKRPEFPLFDRAPDLACARRDLGGSQATLKPCNAEAAMGELNQLLLNFLFTFVFWLEKVIIELALPALLIGGLVLIFSRKWGWRIIWATGLAVFIALFAKPVAQALPGIVSSVSFP